MVITIDTKDNIIYCNDSKSQVEFEDKAKEIGIDISKFNCIRFKSIDQMESEGYTLPSYELIRRTKIRALMQKLVLLTENI